MPVEVQEEEFVIHILREPGQGLGISIAGGKGSTPVKGNDEVKHELINVLLSQKYLLLSYKVFSSGRCCNVI